MGDPLKGKLAAVLQTSALGGPTLSTRIEAPDDIREDFAVGYRSLDGNQTRDMVGDRLTERFNHGVGVSISPLE